MIELKFGTQAHALVLTKLQKLYSLGSTAMGKKKDIFRTMDKTYSTEKQYFEQESKSEFKQLKQGKRPLEHIEVPYVYAMVNTAQAYMTQVFLRRDPLFNFIGLHGEGEQSVQAVEALLSYQTSRPFNMKVLHSWVFDALKYGVGVLGMYWEEERNPVSTRVRVPMVKNGIVIPDRWETKEQTVEVEGYMGNKFFNVDPYMLLPDPRVPLSRLQDGEFIGRMFELSQNDIQRGKLSGKYMNTEVLAAHKNKNSVANTALGSLNSDWSATHNGKSWRDLKTQGDYSCYEMSVDIIPSEWGLGSRKSPEKWDFVVVNRSVIIEAAPASNLHCKFPYIALELEQDAYKLFNASPSHQLVPLVDMMSWMFNTHITNVRRAVNDQWIYDPSMVVEADILSEDPGKRIRARPAAYGEPLDKLVHQLPVTDVTRTHVQDVGIIGEMGQLAMGVNNDLMGRARQGGRRSATEARNTLQQSAGRLQGIADFMSISFGEVASMGLKNSQQYYSTQQKFRIAGDTLGTAGDKFLNITPESIRGDYDVIPIDGSAPIDKFATLELMIRFFDVAGRIPDIAVEYNLPSMLAWVLQYTGFRNMQQFKREGQPGAVPLQQATPKGSNVTRPTQVSHG